MSAAGEAFADWNDQVLEGYAVSCRTTGAIVAILILLMHPIGSAWAQDTNSSQTQPDVASFEDAIQESRTNMMANPPAALASAEQAEAYIETYVPPMEQGVAYATTWWLQAEALTRLARPGDAQPLAVQALEQLGSTPQRNKLYADILLCLGRTNKMLGEHGRALEHFQRAYEVFLELGETRSQSIILQSIGSIYNDARQFERAVDYYADAIERYQDPSLDLSAFNNLANVYRELGRRDEALEYFNRARTISQEIGSAMLEARILSNIAEMHIAFQEYEAAEASILLAFEKAGDPTGAEWARFMWGVRAQAAAGQGRYQDAQTYIERTFDGVDMETTSQHFTKFHGAAADIYQALENWRVALPHLRAFKRLEDESREFGASANTALVGAQFDFAEQELEIEQLRITSLEQDLELSAAQAQQRLYIFGGLLVTSILIGIGIYMRNRAARERAKTLEHALYFDAETGLPSRQNLVRQVERAPRQLADEVFVVALQLDRHSHLESVLGFDKYSELLGQMAVRLEAIGGIDSATRISSGILGVKLDCDEEREASRIAEQMRDCLFEPIHIDDLDIDISVTTGIARHENGEMGLKNALIALQQAQEEHVSNTVFDAEKYGDPSGNLALMGRMLSATQNGEMVLHYQPKLNLRTGQIQAAEALCRWMDPERGFISPDSFIPQAEETGHIRAFTEWTIDQTARDQVLMHAAGHRITLAVNISGALLVDDKFARIAMRLANQAPGSISFEITETAVMHDPERAMANLEMWSKAGIKLAIDDYGSGLSSLAYLKSLPCQELKLDRAFITDVATSNRDRMLVKSTVDLAHNLGLEMTAEGVESEEGMTLLKLLGCDWIQGYVLSKALPLGELIGFLGDGRNEDPGIESINRSNRL
jgi:EAL domain-containing protein (putative c-di-GMP-specific phosphodiesterase class I)/GGDEF domain-containing protein